MVSLTFRGDLKIPSFLHFQEKILPYLFEEILYSSLRTEKEMWAFQPGKAQPIRAEVLSIRGRIQVSKAETKQNNYQNPNK